MAKYEKYFLAIVPEADIQQRITVLKENIKSEFNVKYSLKSPGHVTLKMPFSYNEAKEDRLISTLQDFLSSKNGFELELRGVSTFGSRVVFIGVEENQELMALQASLLVFCKKELKQVEELSDRNYHPHLTIAFKDLKKEQIPNIIQLARNADINLKFDVNQIVLLKRINHKWQILKRMSFKAE